MSTLSTHVLDTALGRPAEGMHLRLEALTSAEGATEAWREIGQGTTNADGRVSSLLAPDAKLSRGTYRLTFETGAYHRAQGVAGFYPSVSVRFVITEDAAHYHVPLLISPFGYSTYRGS